MSSIFKSGDEPLHIGVYHRIAYPNAMAVCSKELLKEQWRKEIHQHINMIIADYYFDDSPAGTENSPEQARLLADCRAGKIDAVMVRNVKHLSNSNGMLSQIVSELSRLEPPVNVYFTAEQEGANLMKIQKDGDVE